MPDIPLVDLRLQYQSIKPEIDDAVARVLARGQFVLGPEGEALEQEIASYCGTAHAVAVASGTDALELSLRACGIGPGDEVITTAFSFFATAEAILAAGARPVFVDIDPVTYTLDGAQVEAQITSRTKAILPVHLYGHPCEMDSLVRIATKRGLALIEDCAQAMGARHRNRRVGSFGTAGCFSFYPTKNLGAFGDGGMVVTNDHDLAERIRLLRTHGSRGKFSHVALGKNSRLDELQAAILRAKLPHLDSWNEARRGHAETYRRMIKQAGLKELALPQERSGCWSVYHLYVIRSARRDALCEGLTRQGIGAQIYYPATLPQQPALAHLGYRNGQFPQAEKAASEVLALPLFPELTKELIETVVTRLQGLLSPSTPQHVARS